MMLGYPTILDPLVKVGSLKCFVILQDHFEFIKFIGFSKFSEVSAVRHKIRKNEEYAIKKTRRQFRSHKDRERRAISSVLPSCCCRSDFEIMVSFRRCMQEIRAVMALDPHPNIVGQYRAWQQAGHFYIQMDLCTGGSLSSMLDNARNTDEHLDDSELWRILLDVSQGLAFLHKSGVTHLDIKPENIYKYAVLRKL